MSQRLLDSGLSPGHEFPIGTCDAHPKGKRCMDGITVQLRRAAVSVPSNIAEGQMRAHVAEFVQFVATARGSLAEVDTQLEIASRLGYVESARCRLVREQIAGIARGSWR